MANFNYETNTQFISSCTIHRSCTCLILLSPESAELFEPQLADYHNYTELMEELDSLVEEFPDLARLYSLGQTHEDRDLAVIQITQGVNEVKCAWRFLYPVSCFYCALRFP